MKKAVKWLVWVFGLNALMYFAFIQGVAGALNVLKFCVWFFALLIPVVLVFVLAKTYTPDEDPLKGYTKFNTAVSHIQNFSLFACWVWFGHIFTAIAMLWMLFATYMFKRAIKENYDEAQAKAAAQSPA